MQRNTGKTGLMNRRSFARLALGAAGALVAGPALAAQEDEPLHDYVPDSQDVPRLLRRISGLHTEEWPVSYTHLTLPTNSRV